MPIYLRLGFARFLNLLTSKRFFVFLERDVLFFVFVAALFAI